MQAPPSPRPEAASGDPASGNGDGDDHGDSHGNGHGLTALSLGALGVVYGDIGTTPLYALKECFGATSPHARGVDARRTCSACCRSSSGR